MKKDSLALDIASCKGKPSKDKTRQMAIAAAFAVKAKGASPKGVK